jgi:hypothetical protein
MKQIEPARLRKKLTDAAPLALATRTRDQERISPPLEHTDQRVCVAEGQWKKPSLEPANRPPAHQQIPKGREGQEFFPLLLEYEERESSVPVQAFFQRPE